MPYGMLGSAHLWPVSGEKLELRVLHNHPRSAFMLEGLQKKYHVVYPTVVLAVDLLFFIPVFWYYYPFVAFGLADVDWQKWIAFPLFYLVATSLLSHRILKKWKKNIYNHAAAAKIPVSARRQV